MTIEVRPIRPGEGAALLTIMRALAASHGFLDKQTATADDLERALFAGQPIVGCLLAFFEEKPAGCAFWHRSFTTARGQEVIYLEDLSVLPEFRRKGVARAAQGAGGRSEAARLSQHLLAHEIVERGCESPLCAGGLADDALTRWAETAP